MHEIWPDYKTTPYLAAEDLNNEEVTLTVAEVDEEEFDNQGEKVTKPILRFQEKLRGKQKWLVLNATNRLLLQDIFGIKICNCIGKQIVLYPTTTSYGAKVVPCLRIKEVPDHAETEES